MHSAVGGLLRAQKSVACAAAGRAAVQVDARSTLALVEICLSELGVDEYVWACAGVDVLS